MIITAMIIYGIIQGKLIVTNDFIAYFFISFIMDVAIAEALSPKKESKKEDSTSAEELYYWKKKAQVAELERVKLDRELYGGGK